MHLGMAYLWDGQIEKSKEYNGIALALDSTDKTLDFYLAHVMGNNEKAYDLLAHNIIPSQSSQIDSLYTNKDVEIITRHSQIEGKKAAQAISDEKNKQHLTILFSLFICILLVYPSVVVISKSTEIFSLFEDISTNSLIVLSIFSIDLLL